MKNLIESKRGVTLTELLVAAALIAVVAFPSGMILLNNTRIIESGREKIALQTTAQIAMNGVYEVLLSAQGIILDEAGALGTEGFIEARRLRVKRSGGAEAIIAVSNGQLAFNSKPQANGILLEVLSIDGDFTDCRGLRLRVTAYRGSPSNVERYVLVGQVYFRNGV